MKKIKTLGTMIAAVGILGFTVPAFAADQKFEVPKYDPKQATKEVSRLTLEDGTKAVHEYYLIDRDDDGIVDMCEINYYEIKEGKQTEPEKYLYIDDTLNYDADRVLLDFVKADGSKGADGIYDSQYPVEVNIKKLVEYLRLTHGKVIKAD